jgi:hypothetical protein
LAIADSSSCPVLPVSLRTSELRSIKFVTANVNRRAFLETVGSAAALTTWSNKLLASAPFRRRRPYEAGWPSKAAWKRLNDAVGGNLISVEFPLAACRATAGSAECKTLFENLRSPYYIGGHPGLTQTLGWVDAWTTRPSIYAVAAKSAADIAAAVNFARENECGLSSKAAGTVIRALRMHLIPY